MRLAPALFAIAALVAGAIAVALLAGGDSDSSPPAVETTTSDRQEGEPRVAAALDRLRRASVRAARGEDADDVEEIAGDPRDEHDPGARERAAYGAERRSAEEVARRFFAAFALYELGAVGGQVEDELHATTTSTFARELLGARPARIPPGAEPPAAAALVRLEFVPGESEVGRLVSLELVATVDREGTRTPLAIALRRDDDGWRVAALRR